MANPNVNKKTKIICEDDVCLLEEESSTDGSSAWLDLFCPRSSCELTSPTQLP